MYSVNTTVTVSTMHEFFSNSINNAIMIIQLPKNLPYNVHIKGGNHHDPTYRKHSRGRAMGTRVLPNRKIRLIQLLKFEWMACTNSTNPRHPFLIDKDTCRVSGGNVHYLPLIIPLTTRWKLDLLLSVIILHRRLSLVLALVITFLLASADPDQKPVVSIIVLIVADSDLVPVGLPVDRMVEGVKGCDLEALEIRAAVQVEVPDGGSDVFAGPHDAVLEGDVAVDFVVQGHSG